MKINQDDLNAAVEANIINNTQAQQLWSFWQVQQKDVVSFKFSHILYYLGGLIAISAVTLFVTQAWNRVQGYPLLFLALAFFLLGISLTHLFLQKGLRIPAGIMATFALALVPLVVYNIQIILGYTPNYEYNYTDFHYWINWYWVSMEIATIIVGIIMLYFYRFPFLLFPISVVLWYMSMDLWPLLLKMHEYTYADKAKFTMIFGLIMLACAVLVDFYQDDAKRQDYAFWLYIFGVMTFWGGLTGQSSDSELSKFFYLLINIILLLVGAFLVRRVFVVFGAIGIFMYLGHLAFDVFKNSLGFNVALVFFGILIIIVAAYSTRIEKKLHAIMEPYIPKKLLKRQ